MSAQLVVMNATVDVDNPKQKELELREALFESYRAVNRRLEENVGYATPESEGFRQAVSAFAEFFERRVRALEFQYRSLLANDALDDDQRQLLLAGLYGRRHVTNRDAKILRENEAEILAMYRALEARDKQFLRSILSRFGLGPTTNGDRAESAK